jgi:hypothetical protein
MRPASEVLAGLAVITLNVEAVAGENILPVFQRNSFLDLGVLGCPLSLHLSAAIFIVQRRRVIGPHAT